MENDTPPPTPIPDQPAKPEPSTSAKNPPHEVDDMPTRNAEEADLSDASQERSNSRQKTTPDSDDVDMAPPHQQATPPTEQPQADKDHPDQGDKTNIPNLDAVHYLTTPKPDPLEVQGWDDNTTLEGINPIQQSKWKNDAGDKVLIYKAYGSRIDTKDKVSLLRDVIKEALGMSSNLTIAVPVPENTNNRRDYPPFCALVKGISAEEAKELIEKVQPTPNNKATPLTPPT